MKIQMLFMAAVTVAVPLFAQDVPASVAVTPAAEKEESPAPISTEAVAGLDVAQLDIGIRHAQHEVGQTAVASAALKVHAEALDVQSRLLLKRQSLDVHVQRVF